MCRQGRENTLNEQRPATDPYAVPFTASRFFRVSVVSHPSDALVHWMSQKNTLPTCSVSKLLPMRRITSPGPEEGDDGLSTICLAERTVCEPLALPSSTSTSAPPGATRLHITAVAAALWTKRYVR